MKEILLGLMEVLMHQKISLILILAKQTQNFALVYIKILIILIHLLMKNKYLNLKSTIKMLTFQLNFVWEVFLIDLVLMSLDKYL